jgi:hypothetical protein
MTRLVLVHGPRLSVALPRRSVSLVVLLAMAVVASCGSTPSGAPRVSADQAPGTQRTPASLVRRQEVALGKDVSLVLETRAFEAKRHDVRLCAEGVPCLIDGKPVFGTHGSLPSIEIVSLTLRMGERRIPLDASAMYNPWSPREDRDVYAWLSRELGDRLVIRGEFSDGAAAYVAEWEVVEGSALRTVLKCAECLSMACRGFETAPR